MKKFTVGFLFTPDLEQVLLIKKIAPEWQKGKLNGLGGKIEKGEGGLTCFLREIEEESGIVLEKKQARLMGSLKGVDWQVYVFGVIYKGDLFDAKTHEKEKIEWFKVADLPSNCLPNVMWMIPFIRNELKAMKGNSFVVEEKSFDSALLRSG